jgi:hypothetical protein
MRGNDRNEHPLCNEFLGQPLTANKRHIFRVARPVCLRHILVSSKLGNTSNDTPQDSPLRLVEITDYG